MLIDQDQGRFAQHKQIAKERLKSQKGLRRLSRPVIDRRVARNGP